jgi:hypothetical protein
MLNNVIKSLKAGGFIEISQDPGSITVKTTSNLDNILSTKANSSSIPSLIGYLNAATNNGGDTNNPKLIVLGTNGSNLTIDYTQLRTALTGKQPALTVSGDEYYCLQAYQRNNSQGPQGGLEHKHEMSAGMT